MASGGGAQAQGGLRQTASLTVNILFEHGNPVPLRPHLREYSVDCSAEMGEWELPENGELLRTAREDGYEVILSTDQNIRYQQNLVEMGLAVVVLKTPN